MRPHEYTKPCATLRHSVGAQPSEHRGARAAANAGRFSSRRVTGSCSGRSATCRRSRPRDGRSSCHP